MVVGWVALLGAVAVRLRLAGLLAAAVGTAGPGPSRLLARSASDRR